MKRPRMPPPTTLPPQPLAAETLARIRGGHAIVDPLAGAFRNFDPVAVDQQ